MAEDRYFVLMGDSQVGPLGIQQVRNMRNAGTIQEDTLLWREGDPEWLPSSSFAGVLDDEVTEISSEPVVAPRPESRQSADPDAPRITPSGIWREIEAEREQADQIGEPSVEQIASSVDEPTTDEPTIPSQCPSCGAEIQYCPVCGKPLHEHDHG